MFFLIEEGCHLHGDDLSNVLLTTERKEISLHSSGSDLDIFL